MRTVLLSLTLLVGALSHSSAMAETVKVCDQTVAYTISPPGSDVPANMRGFSGVWIGNLDLMCYGVIVESIKPDGEVQLISISGRWSGSGGAFSVPAGNNKRQGRIEGNKLSFQGPTAQVEYVLRSPTELRVTARGSSWSNEGTLQRQ